MIIVNINQISSMYYAGETFIPWKLKAGTAMEQCSASVNWISHYMSAILDGNTFSTVKNLSSFRADLHLPRCFKLQVK